MAAVSPAHTVASHVAPDCSAALCVAESATLLCQPLPATQRTVMTSGLAPPGASSARTGCCPSVPIRHPDPFPAPPTASVHISLLQTAGSRSCSFFRAVLSHAWNASICSLTYRCRYRCFCSAGRFRMICSGAYRDRICFRASRAQGCCSFCTSRRTFCESAPCTSPHGYLESSCRGTVRCSCQSPGAPPTRTASHGLLTTSWTAVIHHNVPGAPVLTCIHRCPSRAFLSLAADHSPGG